MSFKMPLMALAAIIANLPAAHAEDGVSTDKIVLGQAAALSGPAAALGQDMKVGLEAAFAEVNKAGGVKGRKLELKSVDDGYEPTRSIGVVKKLLEEDKVFAIVGTVGTPTAAAIQPIATNAGVPMIGAFTGVEFLREPYKPLVMNVRATYYQETEAMVEHLTKDLGVTRIGIMYQDDAYGQAGLAGAAARAGKAQHETRRRGHVRAQHCRGQGCAARRAKGQARGCGDDQRLQAGGRVHQTGAPDQVRSDLRQRLLRRLRLPRQGAGPAGAGVVITQVVPFPLDGKIPVVGRYQASLKASGAGCAARFRVAGGLSGRPHIDRRA